MVPIEEAATHDGMPRQQLSHRPRMGDDFIDLHTAVRKHYSEPTVVLSGVMNSINVRWTPLLRQHEG